MRPLASLSVRVAVVTLVLGGVFACAEGTAPEDVGLGIAPKTTNNPTEPPGESVTVPSEGERDGSTAPATDAGKSDASAPADAGKDAATVIVDAGTDSGSVVVPAPDAGACTKAPPSNVCGVAPQCGCAANETCDVTNTSTGAVSCVLAGGGPQGSVCTVSAQCAKGLTCQFGACRPYCGNPGGLCSGATVGICYAPANAAGAATPNLSVCSIKCDPRNPSAACASNTCLWFAGDQQGDCNTPGTKTVYQACSSLVDCAAGLQCAFDPLSLGNACLRWCRIGSSDCPGLFDSCDDVYGANAPVVGGQKYGLCR
jgi:hypothetical protein